MPADAVILQFPLWWFGMPAILKGWIDRVFAYGLAYGFKGAGNRYRYGDGGFKGKRALLCVTVGGPTETIRREASTRRSSNCSSPSRTARSFSLVWTCCPPMPVYGTGQITAEDVAAAKATWRLRLERLFEDAAIPFRPQNGGDYPDGHVLASHVAIGQSGVAAQSKRSRCPSNTSSSARGRSALETVRSRTTAVTTDIQYRYSLVGVAADSSRSLAVLPPTHPQPRGCEAAGTASAPERVAIEDKAGIVVRTRTNFPTGLDR